MYLLHAAWRLAVLLLALGFSSAGLAQAPTTTLTFGLSDFTVVSVSTVFNVAVIQGTDFSVTVTVDADVANRVAVGQTGNTLNISLRPGDDDIDTLEAVVTMPVKKRSTGCIR